MSPDPSIDLSSGQAVAEILVTEGVQQAKFPVRPEQADAGQAQAVEGRGLDHAVDGHIAEDEALAHGKRRGKAVFSDDVARQTGLARQTAGPAFFSGFARLRESLRFPREHAVWVRTNNVCERMNCEIKRRTRVVQVFPSRESLVRLVGAVCCDQNDAWLSATNFIDRRSWARRSTGS